MHALGLHAVNALNRYPVAMAITGRLGRWLILLLSDPTNVANNVLWSFSAVMMTQATITQPLFVFHSSSFFFRVEDRRGLSLWLMSECFNDSGKVAVWTRGDTYMGNSI